MNTVVEKKKAPIAAAWVCLVLAWVFMLLPIPVLSGMAGWSLNLVAFILAILIISKGRTGSGIFLLGGTVVVSPIVYFIGLALLAAAIEAGDGKSRADTASAPQDASANIEEPVQRAEIAVSSRELYAAYDENEIAADQLYKGKWLLVTGTVESISSDMADEPAIQLLGDGYFTNVHVEGLPVSVAMTLSKGQSISVLCLGAGEVLGSPMLDKCEIQ